MQNQIYSYFKIKEVLLPWNIFVENIGDFGLSTFPIESRLRYINIEEEQEELEHEQEQEQG